MKISALCRGTKTWLTSSTKPTKSFLPAVKISHPRRRSAVGSWSVLSLGRPLLRAFLVEQIGARRKVLVLLFVNAEQACLCCKTPVKETRLAMRPDRRGTGCLKVHFVCASVSALLILTFGYLRVLSANFYCRNRKNKIARCPRIDFTTEFMLLLPSSLSKNFASGVGSEQAFRPRRRDAYSIMNQLKSYVKISKAFWLVR